MEFKMERASLLLSNKKPIQDVRLYSKKYPRWKDAEGHYSGEELGWFMKINTLEELMEFYKEYGDVVIRTNWGNEDITELIIYDDYLE